MTYSLFEFAKEKAGDLIIDDPESVEESAVSVRGFSNTVAPE